MIFAKESQTVLAEFCESVQENILSGDKLEMHFDEKAVSEIKDSGNRAETVNRVERRQQNRITTGYQGKRR